MFEMLRRRRLREILKKVDGKDLIKRYLLLSLGCFIVALAFNVFFLQYGIVCFGVSGVSIILNEFGVNPSVFILIANVLLLIVSYFTLGFEDTKNSVVGSLMFPIFVTLTSYLVSYVNVSDLELITIAIFGAVLTGIGMGIIFKTGFTTGGTDILNQIMSKYFKISIGKAILIIDGLIVISAKLVFTWEIVLYGFIVLFIISYLTDKVLLGISQSKAFYIVTEKEEEAREYLIGVMNTGVTLIN